MKMHVNVPCYRFVLILSVVFCGFIPSSILAGTFYTIKSYDGEANLRATPGGQLVDVLYNGDKIRITERNGSWAKGTHTIDHNSFMEFDSKAFVHASLVDCNNGPAICKIKSEDGFANIRNQSSLNGAIIEVLDNTSFIEVTGKKGSWFELKAWAPYEAVNSVGNSVWVHDSLLASNPNFSPSANVPYFCQNTNYYRPSATCGNTSLAMALSYVLNKSVTPDYLYSYNYQKFGYRMANSRYRFADVAKSLGAHGSKAAILTESQMKSELDKGNVLVMQGKFTNSYGHIVLVIGYNSTGFVVHDPFGKWKGSYTGSGYYKCSGSNATGKNVTYSYSQFKSQSLVNPNFSVGIIAK